MPFDSNNYLNVSDNYLPNTSWPNNVFHFGPSGFYDFEMDNEPIFDLEDRTNYLYNMLGGSIPVNGVILVVSSTIPSQPTNGLRYFNTIQGAIDALPQYIDEPVMIEVAVPGALGNLKLKDLSFGPKGGLEIINRYFSKAFQFSGASFTQSNSLNVIDSNSIWLSSIDITNTINNTVLKHGGNTIQVNSGWDVSANIRSIAVLPEVTTFNNGLAKTNRYFFVNTGEDTDFTPGDNKYKLHSNVANGTSWYHPNYTTLGTPSTTNHRYMLNEGSTAPPMVGLTYANYLSGVEILDCGGPIYFRGFFIDGNDSLATTPTKFTSNIGLKINNCSNLIIENCTIARFETGGCKVVNSDVIFSKGFISAFNFLSIAGPYLSSNESYGLYLDNSNVVFSAINNNLYKPADCPFILAYNEHGIKAYNSKIVTNHFPTWVSENKDVVSLQICNNFDIGLEMHDSLVDINGRLALFLNKIGLKAMNSELHLADFTIDNNTLFGVSMFDSNLEYNRHFQNFLVSGADKYWARAQFNIEHNGQNIHLVRSTFIYEDGFPHDTVLSNEVAEKIGITRVGKNSISDGKNIVPSVFIEGGSTLKLANVQAATKGFTYAGTGIITPEPYFDTLNGIDFTASSTVDGALFKVDTGSTLELHGTKNTNGRTTLLGPSSREKQRKISAISASNGSTVRISGPTTIAQVGVGIHVNNGSTLEISPHRFNGVTDRTYMFATTPAALCSGNHTEVEIHSTKSGIFADNSSNVLLKDLGDYHSFWGNDASSFTYNKDDVLSLSASTSAGGIRFFANTPGTSVNPSSVFSVSAAYTFEGGFTYSGADHSSLKGDNDKDQYLGFSRGGMCVVAQRGSNVIVKNVHFPANHYNPSAVILDENAGMNCGMLYGWAIDQDSTLNASYCSVKGTMPVSAGNNYHGPKMLYSGTCGNGYLSGAPSATPDSYEISILDSFGGAMTVYVPSLALNKYIGDGVSGVQSNKGPFRLFFTPTGKAKFLGYAFDSNGILGPATHATNFTASGVWYGEPYQILAQGYNPPIDLSSTYAPSMSGTFPDIGSSGLFAYVKDYISPTYRDRIVFDESAMDTFANARNALTGKSNRLPLITMVSNRNNPVGEGGSPDHGDGLISLVNLDLDKDV